MGHIRRRLLRAQVLWLLALLALALPRTVAVLGQEGKPRVVTAAQRERAALEFVRTHHQELAVLLDRLKTMNPEEYRKAIGELYQVSRSLESWKQKDQERYELGLQAWKAKSRVELVAAQLASAPGADSKLEEKLREALAAQSEVEIRQLCLERKQLADRLKRLDSSIERLEKNKAGVVESRFENLLRKGQTAYEGRVGSGQRPRVDAGGSPSVKQRSESQQEIAP